MNKKAFRRVVMIRKFSACIFLHVSRNGFEYLNIHSIRVFHLRVYILMYYKRKSVFSNKLAKQKIKNYAYVCYCRYMAIDMAYNFFYKTRRKKITLNLLRQVVRLLLVV